MLVAAVGDLAADVWLRLLGDLTPGGKVLSGPPEIRLGGMAFNFSREILRLDLRAALVADVGRDSAGDRVMALLTQTGIDVTAVDRIDGMAFQVLVLDGGQNQPTLIVPASAHAFPSMAAERALALKPDWVHSSVLEPAGAVQLLRTCQAAGIRCSADLELQALARRPTAISELWVATSEATVAFVNAASAELLRQCFPDWPGDRRSKGIVVETRGSLGGVVHVEDEHHPYEARSMRASTVGAGDRFAAGFSAGLILNFAWQRALTMALESASGG